MILGIGAEGGIFLYAGLAGMSVLCTYYILICFRKLIRHSDLASGIEDVIFWIAASIYIFRRMYETDNIREYPVVFRARRIVRSRRWISFMPFGRTV